MKAALKTTNSNIVGTEDPYLRYQSEILKASIRFQRVSVKVLRGHIEVAKVSP
uniref:Uncharacterized protein n=1 Tax=Arion vulgaris TaxID=1028688 RepID=A0A0B7AID4_9EUPU